MTGVAVYMEGGGDSREGKAQLRQGMSESLNSLRDAARQKKLHWKVVACGSRNDTHNAFLNAWNTSPSAFNILLVDSEESVADVNSPRAHLKQRDGWDLAGINERSIHLMIQVMEAWIIADVDAIAKHYEQRFQKGAFPPNQNLEGVEKVRIYSALKQATAKTQKGEYHKTRHAAVLLARIDPANVRQRCPSCDRLFVTLEQSINAS